MFGLGVTAVVLVLISLVIFFKAKGKEKLKILAVFIAGLFIATTSLGALARDKADTIGDGIGDTVTAVFRG